MYIWMKEIQTVRNSMDYIYTSGEQEIIIEVEQRDTRHSVIDQYVQCRKLQGFQEVISQDLRAEIIILLWNNW